MRNDSFGRKAVPLRALPGAVGKGSGDEMPAKPASRDNGFSRYNTKKRLDG